MAANSELRAALAELCAGLGVRLYAPPLELCTDNAAMIAAAARFTEPLPYPDYLASTPAGRVAVSAPRDPLRQARLLPLRRGARRGRRGPRRSCDFELEEVDVSLDPRAAPRLRRAHPGARAWTARRRCELGFDAPAAARGASVEWARELPRATGRAATRPSRTPPPERLSLGVAARLSRYLQVLTQAQKMGKETISSQELADYTHVNSTQIRRDLSGFGKFGKRGVGYNVDSLVSQIRKILRTSGQHNIALFGAGHLGQAIAGLGHLRRPRLPRGGAVRHRPAARSASG